MTIRYISIGISLAVLLVLVGMFGWYFFNSGPFRSASAAQTFWAWSAFTGIPPIISIAITRNTKHSPSHIFSAVISLLYGLVIAYIVISIVFFGAPAGSPVMVLLGWLLLLPILLPLWIINIVIEVCCRIHHRKKNQPIPSEP